MKVVVVLVTALAAGCTTAVDFVRVRSEHHKSSEEMRNTQARELLKEGVLDLEQCITLALEHNLDLELSRIRKRLQELDKDAAFSYFLPQMELQVSRTGTDRPHEIKAGGNYMSMTDQHITNAALSLQQGVFIPQAWYLYQMQKKGLDIQRLLHERLRQQIALQVTARYMGCLTFKARDVALRQRVNEAQAIVCEMEALCRESMATASALQQTRVLLLARQTELETNQRALHGAKAELLSVLGLSPLAVVALKPITTPKVAVADLPTLISQALMQRLEMHVADRKIELEKDNVRRALFAFFPSFGITGGLSRSSDSFLHYATTWSYGLVGVMTVFDGFRNVAEYKAAKAKRQQAFVEREQRCLAIMLEVIAAHRALQDASAQLELTSESLLVAEAKLKEEVARRREGLSATSSYLSVLATRDDASAQHDIVAFRHALTQAVLVDVCGGLTVPKSNKNKK